MAEENAVEEIDAMAAVGDALGEVVEGLEELAVEVEVEALDILTTALTQYREAVVLLVKAVPDEALKSFVVNVLNTTLTAAES